MSTWYLNAALTAWRKKVNSMYPRRDKQSDGTLGDTAHAASASEHNPDADGSVDAWDMDVDLDGTNNDSGPATKIEDLKKAFQADPRSQLWIHAGQIANRDVGNWKRRKYTRKNSHRRHVHWQSRPSGERSGKAWTVGSDKVNNATNTATSSGKAKFGTRVLQVGMTGADVAFLQRWLGVEPDDGDFGPVTEAKVKAYQQMRGISADGVVGPATVKQMGVK